MLMQLQALDVWFDGLARSRCLVTPQSKATRTLIRDSWSSYSAVAGEADADTGTGTGKTDARNGSALGSGEGGD